MKKKIMKIGNKTIAIGCCLMQSLGLQAANAAGEAVEYRFELTLSPTAQTTPFDPLDVFPRPADIALAKDGSLWLVDSWGSRIWFTGNWGARIQHFDAQGQFIGEFGKSGNAAGEFYQPQGLAIADDNSLWVADTYNNRVQHLNPEGHFLGQFTESIVNSWYWRIVFEPTKIAIAPNGSFWVMKSREDLIFNRTFYIAHHNVDGSVIAEFPRTEIFMPGSGNLQPGNIAAAQDGSGWVVDTKLNRIQHFDAKLKLLSQFGSAGAGSGQFNAPEGIAVAADGSIWVADTDNNRIQHFKTDGSFIAQYGSLGSALGQFNAPKDVEIAENGSLWVMDSGNHRIQKFVPKKIPSSPAEYDDKNGLLYLDDVAVSGVHYQATLQLQNDQYRLLTVLPALNVYSPAASFDATSNLLSIPLAHAFGQDYQAQFKYLGDSLFQLQSATLK